MADEATVSAADIARLAGVGRAAVSNWRRRHPDFPPPIGGTPTSPLFALADVETWLRTQGKLAELPLPERAWQEVRAAAGDDLNLPATLAATGTLLLAPPHLTPTSDHDPARPSPPGQRTAQIPGHGQDTVARHGPAATWAGAAAGPQGLSMAALPAVAELAALRGPAEVFEFLLDRYQETQSRRITTIPAELARLMAELAGPAATILDPACGTGDLLRAARTAAGGWLLGQEAELETARLAEVRLALGGQRATVVAGDSLMRDGFAGVRAEAVLCDPPFGDRGWGHEDLAADPRWEYGTPPRAEPELAWVQHALAHLADGGRAVVLMPLAAANRRSGRRIRAELLRRGALRAVLAPHGPLHIWLLKRPEGPPRTVLMVDGAERERMVAIWRAYEQERPCEEPGVSRAVPVIDLLDEEVDLTPARHLAVPVRTADGISRTHERLRKIVGDLGDLLPPVRPAGEPSEPQTVPVAELARIGQVELHQAPLRRDAEETGQGEPLLTAEDVVAGRPASGRMPPGDRWLPVRPGDVVVAVAAGRFAARVIEEGGALLGPQLTLLRPRREAIDPYFLAGVLRSSPNVRASTPQTTGGRADVRRAKVPRLPIAEQRRYGEAFRRMTAFETALRTTTMLGAELAQLLADGVTEGMLAPGDQ